MEYIWYIIMTFTALIGFISHSLIHPAIILERWNVLLVCIVTATAASLISAQFANRVNSKTVGRVTGVILTLLGGAMIYLNYFRNVTLPPLVQELGHTLAVLIALFWGALESELTVLTAVLAWGLGDEAAALVGKRYRRHKLGWRFADRQKSYEGSGAMLCVSFLAVLGTLTVGGIPLTTVFLTALVSAVGATVTEAVTRRGYDTVTVPCVAAVLIWLLAG